MKWSVDRDDMKDYLVTFCTIIIRKYSNKEFFIEHTFHECVRWKILCLNDDENDSSENINFCNKNIYF